MMRSLSAWNKCLSRAINCSANSSRNLLPSQLVFVRSPGQVTRKESSNASRRHVTSFYDRYVFPEPPQLISDDEHEKVVSKVNNLMEDPGRLFAIVNISGHQYKITAHDIISISGRIPAECGEKIRLEKVSLVGGSEFTLFGRPILSRDIVHVEATVIEKTPSVDLILKRFIRRKRHERTYKINSLHTILRINSINVFPELE